MKFSGIFFGKVPCFIASDWNINSLFPFQVSILSSLPDLLFFLVIYRGYEKKGSIKLAREYSGVSPCSSPLGTFRQEQLAKRP